MFKQDFDWEVVDFKSNSNRGSRYTNMIWLTGSRSGRLSTLNISWDICEKAGLVPGSRVNLLRSKGLTLFALRKSSVGLITLRASNGNAENGHKYLKVQDQNLIPELLPDLNGSKFDAWVDGDDIIFKPAKSASTAK